MKFHVEMTLVVLLIVLMYTKPASLLALTERVLGKLALVASVLGVAYCYGKNAGILMALIVIILFQNVHEGLDNPAQDGDAAGDDKPTDETTSDSSTPEVEVEVEVEVEKSPEDEEADNDAEQEKAAAAKTTNTIVDNEEKARPVSSQDQSGQESFITMFGGGSCGADSGFGEPVALPSSKEAFTPFM